MNYQEIFVYSSFRIDKSKIRTLEKKQWSSNGEENLWNFSELNQEWVGNHSIIVHKSLLSYSSSSGRIENRQKSAGKNTV